MDPGSRTVGDAWSASQMAHCIEGLVAARTGLDDLEKR